MSTFKTIGLFAAVTALLAVTASPAQAVPYQPNGKIKAQGDAAFLGTTSTTRMEPVRASAP